MNKQEQKEIQQTIKTVVSEYKIRDKAALTWPVVFGFVAVVAGLIGLAFWLGTSQ